MTAKSPNKSKAVLDVVDWLNRQVGTVEKGGQNCIKYWGMSTKPEWNCIGNWCQCFVQVALDQNGHAYIPCSGNLYYLVSAAVYTAKQKGTWIPVEDRIGRVDPAKPNTMYAVVYGFVGGSQFQHIGWMIDWWDNAGNYVQTIEGNTSSGSSGSQNNGEGVYERHRPMNNGYIQVNGFIEYTFEEADMELTQENLDAIARAVNNYQNVVPYTDPVRRRSLGWQTGLANVTSQATLDNTDQILARLGALQETVNVLVERDPNIPVTADELLSEVGDRVDGWLAEQRLAIAKREQAEQPQ